MDVPLGATSPSLKRSLAEALPAGASFTIYHLSTPPLRCSPIFVALPNQAPDRTYCESHFLNIAVRSHDRRSAGDGRGEVLVFGLEVPVYSTSTLTTIFVSKADSTGYLSLLQLSSGTPSVLKAIASTFINFLVISRRRPGIRCLVSLFARAQDQYLYPGSIDNPRKHLLDDRGLIRWWSRVLEPVKNTEGTNWKRDTLDAGFRNKSKAEAYILVPGLDRFETCKLLSIPKNPSLSSDESWRIGHPLYLLSRSGSAYPRALIPRFPDDPKARFVDELDEELPETAAEEFGISPSKRQFLGRWTSITSLEQFWEAMEFRQECSSGRLVGFLWILFTPLEASPEPSQQLGSGYLPSRPSLQSKLLEARARPFNIRIHSSGTDSNDCQRGINSMLHQEAETKPVRKLTKSTPVTDKKPQTKGTLTGIIIPRQPRIKTTTRQSTAPEPPVCTRHYIWPLDSRGQVLLDGKDYNRVNEFLLRLDFSDEDAARGSTARWLQEVETIAGVVNNGSWGESVLGTKRPGSTDPGSSNPVVNILGVGATNKKGKSYGDGSQAAEVASSEMVPTLLSTGLLRKKPKSEQH